MPQLQCNVLPTPILLTGARDGATASFKLAHIEIEEGRIDQDALQVQTNITLWSLPSLTGYRPAIGIPCNGRSNSPPSPRHPPWTGMWQTAQHSYPGAIMCCTQKS
jgi:hypothetical protein